MNIKEYIKLKKGEPYGSPSFIQDDPETLLRIIKVTKKPNRSSYVFSEMSILPIIKKLLP